MNNSSDFVIKNGMLTGYTGPGGDVVIPEGVTEIDDCVFSGCESMKSVTIPGSVTVIGQEAFVDCTGLSSVTIPGSVKSVNWGAFCGCSGLTEATFQSGVKSIDNGAFRDCTSLTRITFPESLTKIGEESFMHCCSLLDVVIPDSVTEIGGCAFCACNKLASVRIGKKIKAIGREAFAECDSLKEVRVAAEEEKIKIGPKAFSKKVTVIFSDTEALREKETPKKETLEKSFAAKEQKKGSKQETMQEPANQATLAELENAFKEDVLTKSFTKKKGTAKAISGVKLLDGSAAPAFLVKCAIVPYLDQLKERPREISTFKTAYVSVSLNELADRAGAMLDKTSLRKALMELFNKGGTAWLLPLCRYADGKTINGIISSMRKWADWSTYREAGRSNIIIARGALMLSDTREAIIELEKTGHLRQYAVLRGADEDSVQDSILGDFGFDASGKKEYDLGGGILTVSITPDLTVGLFDNKAGKIVKSIPKKDAEPDKYEAVKADLDELKKNVKKVVKTRNARLFETFLDGHEFSAESWKASYTNNPVLNSVARLLIWNQDGRTFTLSDGGPIDSIGHSYTVTDKPIKVAHPMEMGAPDVQAWQKYFTRRGLKQPFDQVWEPVIDPETISETRYEDCKIPYYRFLGQEKHGITVEDEDFHNEIRISFRECEASVERIDWKRHQIDPDDCFEVTSFSFTKYTRQVNHIVAYLDRVTVWERVKKDDVSVMELMDQFTLAQITEFIKTAQEANAVNVLALLLEYKNTHFADFDPMDEFTLEW